MGFVLQELSRRDMGQRSTEGSGFPLACGCPSFARRPLHPTGDEHSEAAVSSGAGYVTMLWTAAHTDAVRVLASLRRADAYRTIGNQLVLSSVMCSKEAIWTEAVFAAHAADVHATRASVTRAAAFNPSA